MKYEDGFEVLLHDQVDAGITLYGPVGCEECTEGYKGRAGIYQVMPMSEEIAVIVLEGGNAIQIAEAAQRAGINDLRQSALVKAAAGTTSLAEINRVTKDGSIFDDVKQPLVVHFFRRITSGCRIHSVLVRREAADIRD